MDESVLQKARAYVAAGISVVPIRLDGSKFPSVNWKEYQERLPTDTELANWFDRSKPFGIGLLGGAVSGALEQLDFDHNAAEIFPAWCQLVEETCPRLVERLSVAQTPSGGYHVRYRCPDEEIPGNTDLAINPSAKGHERILIQTRGNGGQALAPGCPAECHPSGRLYEHRSGPFIPPTLNPDERDVLLTCARSFTLETKQFTRQTGIDLRPGDDFDRRGPDWAEILEPLGWRCVFGSPAGERRWRRPGKDAGWSATTGKCHGKDGADLLRVFSSNAAPFRDGMAYGKFRALAELRYGGNLSDAADDLAREGYGHRAVNRLAAESNGHTNGHVSANGAKSSIVAADVATIEDLARIGAQVRWLWERWIPIGVLTAIAAEGGKGKTRFCADLLRRIGQGLPWPDGSPMTARREFLSLWVMADNHHDELVTLAEKFGIGHMIRLNSLKTDPFGGVTLETVEDLARLDSIMKAVQPDLVIVDTVGNATDKNLSRQEDAKAFYFPLQVLARRHACAFACLTHVNANGEFLGRRVREKVRVAIRIQQPKGQERRRLEVVKTNSRKPPPLGMTMGDHGNEYDDHPPEEAEENSFFGAQANGDSAQRARNCPRLQECADWLFEEVCSGPIRVSVTRTKAAAVDFDAKTLYRAKDHLQLEEYTGQDGYKWWSIENPFAQHDGGRG